MTHHGEEAAAPGPRSAKWTERRDSPRATRGELGTIADTLGGDLVAVEVTPTRAIWAEIAWIHPNGKGASARLYNPTRGQIDLRSGWIKVIPADVRVRFLGVRPK